MKLLPARFKYPVTKVKGIIFAASLLTGLPLWAQNNSAQQNYSFSLKQAVEYAISNKPSVQNATLDEKIAQKKVNEITGIGLPQINGSVEFNDFLQLPTSFLPDFISPSVYGVLIKEGVLTPDKFPQGDPALFPYSLVQNTLLRQALQFLS
jgi:hypothetical protein